VTGVARTPPKAAMLRRLGATPVEVSLFDRDALVAAVAGHDAVLNLATSIPTGERAAALEAWEGNHRIRRAGSRNLVDAALAAGATRYVQESIALLYGDGGERLLDESAPVDPTWVTASALDAEAEAARFAAAGGSGVALRFGTFYGADSAHTAEAIGAAHAGIGLEFGPADAYRSPIHADDAAAAAVAALDAPSGVYNVADDQPLTRTVFLAALAAALGVEQLTQAQIELPPEFAMLGRSQRVSNARFRASTGWQPRFPTAWEGWRAVLAELSLDVAS
jgi:nucleoside-diphosphate-sugar epimerase